MIFPYHTAPTTPAAAIHGRAGYITIHYLQFAVWCTFLSMPDGGLSSI
jgi:hypothetical protein